MKKEALKAENEALKVENEALKVENEALKAHTGGEENADTGGERLEKLKLLLGVKNEEKTIYCYLC